MNGKKQIKNFDFFWYGINGIKRHKKSQNGKTISLKE